MFRETSFATKSTVRSRSRPSGAIHRTFTSLRVALRSVARRRRAFPFIRLPVRSPSHHCGAWHCGTRRSYDSHSRVDSSYLHESGTCRVAFRSLGSDRHPTRARERLCAQHLTTDGTCIIENIGTSSRVHWPRHAVIGQRLISWCLIVRILSETHGHAALPPPPTSPSRRHISSSYTKSCLGHRYPALC